MGILDNLEADKLGKIISEGVDLGPETVHQASFKVRLNTLKALAPVANALEKAGLGLEMLKDVTVMIDDGVEQIIARISDKADEKAPGWVVGSARETLGFSVARMILEKGEAPVAEEISRMAFRLSDIANSGLLKRVESGALWPAQDEVSALQVALSRQAALAGIERPLARHEATYQGQDFKLEESIARAAEILDECVAMFFGGKMPKPLDGGNFTVDDGLALKSLYNQCGKIVGDIVIDSCLTVQNSVIEAYERSPDEYRKLYISLRRQSPDLLDWSEIEEKAKVRVDRLRSVTGAFDHTREAKNHRIPAPLPGM